MPRSEGSSESHKTSSGEWRSNVGSGESTSSPMGPIVPPWRPSEDDESRPLGEGPRPRLLEEGSLGSKVGLEGLAGKKVPALRISADGSRIEKFTFDGDKHWQYKALRSDRNKAILTRKHTELDIKNPLASDYLQHHSDAAKESESLRASLKPLRGDVIVVGYDPVLGKPTELTESQWTDLAATLEVINPTISVERMQEP